MYNLLLSSFINNQAAAAGQTPSNNHYTHSHLHMEINVSYISIVATGKIYGGRGGDRTAMAAL